MRGKNLRRRKLRSERSRFFEIGECPFFVEFDLFEERSLQERLAGDAAFPAAQFYRFVERFKRQFVFLLKPKGLCSVVECSWMARKQFLEFNFWKISTIFPKFWQTSAVWGITFCFLENEESFLGGFGHVLLVKSDGEVYRFYFSNTVQEQVLVGF